MAQATYSCFFILHSRNRMKCYKHIRNPGLRVCPCRCLAEQTMQEASQVTITHTCIHTYRRALIYDAHTLLIHSHSLGHEGPQGWRNHCFKASEGSNCTHRHMRGGREREERTESHHTVSSHHTLASHTLTQ